MFIIYSFISPMIWKDCVGILNLGEFAHHILINRADYENFL